MEGYLTSTERTIEDIYIIMQKSINRWEGGIKSSRGAIIPNKSFVYSISFKWDDQGEYSFENTEDHDMGLTVNKEFVERE